MPMLSSHRRGFTLVELLVVIVIISLLAALLIPAIAEAVRRAKITACGNNLRSLHQVLHVYLAERRGRWPTGRGEAFWLTFQETRPPLIDPSSQEILFCVLKGEIGGPGQTDYRGPAESPGTTPTGDPLGADKEGNHGEGHGGNVLLKNGSVQEVAWDEPLWDLCRTKLIP